MKLHQAYVEDLLNKLKKINNKQYNNSRDKDGDIGERFVKDCIKYYMWERDFRVSESGNRTFNLEGQYKVEKSGYGGIDFRFQFVHNNRRYDCYVESKNWDAYEGIPYSTFESEILDRFEKHANTSCIRVVTMNKNNVPFIEDDCKINDIRIWKIDGKITANQLNTSSLKKLMENFLDEIDQFMRDTTGVKLRKSWKMGKDYPDPIDRDIIRGLQPELIASKHNLSEGYISKRKHELKKEGHPVLDGRSRTATLMRLIRKDDLQEMDIYTE